jgi:hypothetical protein
MPWQDTPNGPVFVDANGRAQLRDAEGQVVEVDPQDAGYWLGQGYSQAAERDVAQADQQYQAFEVAASKPWETAAESAAAAGIDLATAPAQLALGAGEILTGRGETSQFLGELRGGITGRSVLGLGGEIAGGQAQAVYEREAAARAEANPWAAFAGSAAVDLAAGIATGGLTASRSLGARLGAEAAMGAFGGANAANSGPGRATAESLLAYGAMGAVLGAGMQGAGEGLSYLGRRVGGAAAKAAPGAAALPTGSGSYASRSSAELIAEASQEAGTGARVWARGSGIASGVDEGALVATAPTNLGPAARELRRRVIESEQILEQASAQVVEGLDTVLAKRAQVTDQVVDATLKRENVERLLDPAAREAQREAALDKVGRLAEWHDAARDDGNLIRLREANDGKLAADRSFDAYRRSVTERLRQASEAAASGDVAGSYINLDVAKRYMQRQKKAWARTAAQGGNLSDLDREAYRHLSAVIEREQEPLRQFLADSATWGKMADAQRAVNAEWEKALEYNPRFEADFLSDMTAGRGDYSGKPDYRAKADRVAKMLSESGRAGNKLAEQVFDQTTSGWGGLVDTIAKYYDVGDEVLTAAREVTEASKKIKAEVGRARDTLAFAGQFKGARNDLSAITGGATTTGAILGGAPGAAIGGALEFGARMLDPAQAISKAAIYERAASAIGERLGSGITGLIRLPSVSVPGGRTAKGAQRAAAWTSLRLGERFASDKEQPRSAYRRRVGDVMAALSSPDRVSREVSAAAQGDPAMSGQMAAGATRAADYLRSRLPGPVIDTRSLTPHLTLPPVTDRQALEWGQRWEGATDPLSALDDAAEGKLTEAKVEAIKTLYPELFARMQDEAIQQLSEAKEPVPYQARVRLGLLLDLGGAADPSLGAEFTRRGLALAQSREAAKQPQGRQSAMKSADRSTTMTEGFIT